MNLQRLLLLLFLRMYWGELQNEVLFEEVPLRSCKHTCQKNTLRVGAGMYIVYSYIFSSILSFSSSPSRFLFRRSLPQELRIDRPPDCGRSSREREGRKNPEGKKGEVDRTFSVEANLFEKSAIQVALGGRPQTCFSCYILGLGLYEHRFYGDRGPVLITAFGVLFFSGMPRRIARQTMAVFNHLAGGDDLSSFNAPLQKRDGIEGFAST